MRGAFFASVRAPGRKISLRAACARTALLAAAGLLTGVVIQFLDRDSPVLGDVFSQMSVWIFLCTALSVGSGTSLRAGVNVFAFLLPMVVAYYATAEALQRPYSMTFVTGWAVCACLSPLFGFFAWYARGKGPIAFLLRVGILAGIPLCALMLFNAIRIADILFALLTAALLFWPPKPAESSARKERRHAPSR